MSKRVFFIAFTLVLSFNAHAYYLSEFNRVSSVDGFSFNSAGKVVYDVNQFKATNPEADRHVFTNDADKVTSKVEIYTGKDGRTFKVTSSVYDRRKEQVTDERTILEFDNNMVTSLTQCKTRNDSAYCVFASAHVCKEVNDIHNRLDMSSEELEKCRELTKKLNLLPKEIDTFDRHLSFAKNGQLLKEASEPQLKDGGKRLDAFLRLSNICDEVSFKEDVTPASGAKSTSGK